MASKPEYSRKHYQKNKLYYLERNRRRKAAIYKFLEDYKATHPCVDCGEVDPVVLEFDHLADKAFNLAQAGERGVGFEKIMAEIEKCEVVCANCHRRRTKKRAVVVYAG